LGISDPKKFPGSFINIAKRHFSIRQIPDGCGPIHIPATACAMTGNVASRGD